MSSSWFPSEFGTSGKSDGTFGRFDKSSLAGGGADADGGVGGDIFDRGCGFGALFKFCNKIWDSQFLLYFLQTNYHKSNYDRIVVHDNRALYEMLPD